MQNLFEKYGRLVAISLLLVLVLAYLNRDYKEPGFYLEQDNEVIYLSDPFGKESRNILNLQRHLKIIENEKFDLVFYFPEFKPERLNLYASPAWELIEDVPDISNKQIEPYHLLLKKLNNKKYMIKSENLPEGSLVSMVYQPPRGAYYFSALARKDFNHLIHDSLEDVEESTLQERFAQSLMRAYDDKHDFYIAAETFLSKSESSKEYRAYQSALHEKSSFKRKKNLEKFIRDYPRSKYRQRAEKALLDTSNHSLRFSSRRSRNIYTKPVASQAILENIVKQYVSSVNTKNYDSARTVATGRASSNLSRLERSKKILDSKTYTGFSENNSSAYLHASDGSKTSFVHRDGRWRISHY